jgi:hypothetical protein
VNKRKNDTIYLNNELQNLKKIMSSYEDQNSKIIKLEDKLKLQKNKYSKRLREIEDIYCIEISELNKKIRDLKNQGFYQTNKKHKNSISSQRNKSNIKNEFKYDYVTKFLIKFYIKFIINFHF